jgi:hypothetical protein
VLQDRGFRWATLWVLEADTQRARPFYEHLGWQWDGARHLRTDLRDPQAVLQYRTRLNVGTSHSRVARQGR